MYLQNRRRHSRERVSQSFDDTWDPEQGLHPPIIPFQLRSLTSSCPLGGLLPLQSYLAFLRFSDRIGSGISIRFLFRHLVLYIMYNHHDASLAFGISGRDILLVGIPQQGIGRHSRMNSFELSRLPFTYAWSGISLRVASPKLIMEEAPESYKDVTQVLEIDTRTTVTSTFLLRCRSRKIKI